LKSKHMYDTAA